MEYTLPASKSDWKDSNVPKGYGALDYDCIMLQSSVAVVFFFVKLAWASVTILGSKLIFWGKKNWNNTLYEEKENIMVGIIM